MMRLARNVRRLAAALCPNWYGLPCRVLWGLALGGASIGYAGSWYVNRPEPPWLRFLEVSATYAQDSKVVYVKGVYIATRTCPPTPENPQPLIWRQEVEGTGPELVQYAPRPAAPTLQIGTHEFRSEIPLTADINPDGWQVSVLVSCDIEPFAIRSRAVKVKYLA